MPDNAIAKIGVLLMTYGSATTADGVREYMNHIYRGSASEEVIQDFEERYRIVGGSPLVAITIEQAKLLEDLLNEEGSNKYVVRAAMLHSAPFIDDAVLALKNGGAKTLRGIILSPQFSSFIMEGYSGALLRSAERHGFKKEEIVVATSWPVEPHFIRLLADRVRESLAMLENKYAKKIPVLFTTHSLPQRVVEKDPNYLKELQMTIEAVLREVNQPNLEWHACYQSAGHTPEVWLKPDLTEILDSISGFGFRVSGSRRKNVPILIVPIQFLADHLEILYDLDVAAKKQCEERGIDYHRIQLPNTAPLFIQSLASVVGGCKNIFYLT